MMKKLLLAVFSITTTFSLYAQREVPQERMEQIYEEVKTPYKYGLAIAPADNHHKIDCPTVFRQGDKCLNGVLWDEFFLTGMENGTVTSVADFLHYRIWNGVEAMNFKLIKAAIG